MRPKEIASKLSEVHGQSPSYKTICYWVREFKRGRTNTKDEHRSGRPNFVTTPEMIETIRQILLKYPKSKVREISNVGRISNERVLNILHDHLDMKKLYSKWVPQHWFDTRAEYFPLQFFGM